MAIMFPILMVYLAVITARRVFFTYQAYKNKKASNNAKIDETYNPMVSIIVPCYNEGKVIKDTLKSLANLNYSNYEIVVVDDGSTDDTLEVLAQQDRSINPRNVHMSLHIKENGGKASALNHGISKANGEFILCVDGDSQLQPDSIRHALKHFKDQEVGAVAGFVEVANQGNLLAKFQEFEYLIGLNFVRRALANYGIVPVIPGPIGMFRKSVLEEVGGFADDRNLMAEDAELSLRIVMAGHKVQSEERMIAYTEAPEDLSSLLRQRYRWNRGIIQAFRMNALEMARGNKRAKALFAHLAFEVYGVLFANLAMVTTFLTHSLVHGQMQLLDKWFIGIILSEVLVTALVTFGHKKKLKWVIITLTSMFSYNILLMFWRMFSMVDESVSKPMTWDKLDRKGIKNV
jgi:poly-beta-1,6 N-acetyl-D-glucosamine synthase